MSDDLYTLTLSVFDSGEARDKLRAATEVILRLEKAYGDAVSNAAEAESHYRMKRAEAFRTHRDTGAPAEAAGVYARGETAVEKKAAMEAAGTLRLAGERLENARDTRRSLWRLVEWSRDVEVAKTRHAQPENVPSDRWP